MPEIVTISHDALMEVNTELPYGHIQESWRHGMFYEEAMLDHIASKYSGGSFIDIGASIGNHTVYFALRCKPDNVYAFEPALESFDHMWRNTILNDLHSWQIDWTEIDFSKAIIKLYPLAMGDHHCHGEMIMPLGGNEGMWMFMEGGGGRVNMTTLDLFDIPDVTLIKIDAEGYEVAILRGALETIKKHKPAIFIEGRTPEDIYEISNILSPIGYWAKSKRFNATPTYELICWKE